ncbi:hypothetical protein [Pseudarthrobacter albicanus]|nr:hypothetical protein [Pseudarthrobacter albicanus]
MRGLARHENGYMARLDVFDAEMDRVLEDDDLGLFAGIVLAT